jgi:hypothetical protein
MQKRDAAWMWSEAFVDAADRSMNDRPVDAAELPDWYEHCNRLARWRHDAEQARKEYLEGRPAQLRDLYNFWRNLRQFRLCGWRSRRPMKFPSKGAWRQPEVARGD